MKIVGWIMFLLIGLPCILAGFVADYAIAGWTIGRIYAKVVK
jgi:hypothetical protein